MKESKVSHPKDLVSSVVPKAMEVKKKYVGNVFHRGLTNWSFRVL
jgi:hypothetical protein